MYNNINTFIKYIYLFTFFTFISCSRSKKDSELFFIQGNVAYKKGNFEEAIKYYTEAIEKTPDFADAFNNRGSVYLVMNNIENAKVDFENAVRIDNEFFLAKYNLAEAYETSNELEKSLELMKQLEKKYKDSSSYFVTMSNILIKKNNYDLAKSNLLKAILLDKKNDKAFTNLGFIQYSEKDYIDAKLNFEKAILLNSKQALAFNNLSLIYSNEENYKKALEMVDKAIEINQNSLFENNKGFYLLNLGKLEEGKMLIDKAIESDANNAWAYRNLGFYYFLNKNYTKAFENFEKSEKLDPSVELLNYYLGLTQKELKNKAKACQYWLIGKKLNEQKSIQLLTKHCK